MSVAKRVAEAAEGRLTLSVAEAGRLLGVSPSTAYRMVRSGQLKTVKVGQRKRVPTEALIELLRSENE